MAETDQPSDYAEALREEGLHVFPLGTKGESAPTWVVNRFLEDEDPQASADAAWPKTPRIPWKEYQTRPPTDAEFEGWVRKFPGCNWGIATGAQIVIVDADTEEGVAFMESGAVTRSPRKVKTSKGAHYYYALTPEFTIRNGAGKHLDIRGQGGYVVAEGSVHATGFIYERDDLQGVPAELLDLPYLSRDDVTAVEAFNKRTTVLATPPAYTEAGGLNFDATLVDPTEPMFDNQPVSTDWAAPGGRNVHASRLAGKYIGQGDDLHTVKAKLDEWNAHNPQPLSQDELNTTIASIARTHTSNHPNKPIIVEPKALEEVPIYDAFKLMGDPRPLPPYVVEGLFRQGDNVVVAGPPKSMKSFLQQQMLTSIAWGDKFIGRETTGERMVAWIQAEMPWYETQRRLLANPRAIERKESGQPANLYITDRLKTLAFDDRGVDYIIEEMIKRFEGEVPAVLAIDSLASVFAEDSENDNADMQIFLREKVGRFREAFGEQLTIVLLHHSNKGKVSDLRKDPFNSLRGASALRGWYSAGLVMFKANPADQHAEVHFEMRGEMPIERVEVELSEGQMVVRELDVDDIVAEFVATARHKTFLELFMQVEAGKFAMSTSRKGRSNEKYAPAVIAKFKMPGDEVATKAARQKLADRYEEDMTALIEADVLTSADLSKMVRKGSKSALVRGPSFSETIENLGLEDTQPDEQ